MYRICCILHVAPPCSRLVHLSQGEDAEDSSVFPSAALHSKLSELAPHAAAAAGEGCEGCLQPHRNLVWNARNWAMHTCTLACVCVVGCRLPGREAGAGACLQSRTPHTDTDKDKQAEFVRAPSPPHTHTRAERARSPGGGGGFALSAMLSRALCLIHRLQGGPQAASQRKPRIICVVGSPDVPMQYIPVMNAIFSAQRANVVIDALVLTPPPSPGRADHPSAAAAAPVAGMSGAAVVPSPPSSSGPDSSFLQQATHLTGGLYFKPADGEALLPYLLNYLAVDTQTRGMLDVPQASPSHMTTRTRKHTHTHTHHTMLCLRGGVFPAHACRAQMSSCMASGGSARLGGSAHHVLFRQPGRPIQGRRGEGWNRAT